MVEYFYFLPEHQSKCHSHPNLQIAGYLLFLDQLPNQFRLLLLVVDLVAAGLHQWQLRIPPPHVKPPLLFIF
jgi:hypothetical protein